MAKTIKLQEEFEALINELERLKSINEITSKNSENATKTIDGIESFVQSVQIFKTTIESDYQSKKHDFEAVEESLNGTLKTFNSIISEQSQKFQTLADNFEKSTDHNLIAILDKFQNKVDDYSSQLKTFKGEVSDDFNHFTEASTRAIDESAKNLNKSITDSHNSLLEEFQLITEKENDVLYQIQSLSSKLDFNRKKLNQVVEFLILAIIVGILSFGFMLYKFW